MASNPNKNLMEAARKATACGMSYGKWVEEGCPEPEGKDKPRMGCKSAHYVFRNSGRRGRKKV